MSTGAAYALRPLDVTTRLVRSTATALVCVVTAAVGHLGAGGALAPSAVLVVFAGSALVAWLLTARRVTPGQMVGLLVLCQVGVHLGATTGEMSMGAGMLIGHVVATAVSAGLLARGEAYVWRLADRLGLRAIASIRVTYLPCASPAAPVAVVPAPHAVRLAHTRVERGPPSGSR